MSLRTSSAQGVEGGFLALVISLMAATCLVLHLGLFLSQVMDAGVFVGMAIGLGIAAYLSYLAMDRANDSQRTIQAIVLVLIIPAVLFVMGMGGFAFGWIALGGIATSLGMPLVQWACGTQPPNATHPIPGAIVAGILLFGFPNPPAASLFLGLGYFSCLLLMASLGGMLWRSRSVGSSVVVDAKGLGRWFVIAGLMLLLCATAGVGVPTLAKIRERDLSSAAQGRGFNPVPLDRGGQRGEGISDQQGNEMPRPNPSPDGAQRQNQPVPGQSDVQQPAKPQQQTPPPPPPPDFHDLAIKALILLVAAAILLWIAKKYGQVILRFLDRAWKFVTGPYVRWRDEKRRLAALRSYEAQLATEMARQGDPFAPLPSEPSDDELGHVYRSLLASAYLLGTEPMAGETSAMFTTRLGNGYTIDRTLLATVSRVCSRSIYAPTQPSASERNAASDAASTIARKAAGQFPERLLGEKKLTYRRLLAERAIIGADTSIQP